MRKYIYGITAAALLCVSCAEWLDVQPKTSVEQDDLFSREYGFKDALTGFYLKMGETDLYAMQMTWYYMDMLAGRYETAPDVYSWSGIYAYDGNYQGTVDMIYSAMYNVIANINNFLKFIEIKKDVIITEHYYHTMKGEALGLRAFLHFDLLRLFGPVYKDNPDGAAVPYRTSFDNIPSPILPASQVLDLCISDLLEAESLLEEHDSRIFGYDSSVDPFTEMRQMRMNLYAVKAMLARAYCYKGDAQSKAKALEYAVSVIESGHFSLASYSGVSAAPVLPTEHIFSLYIDEYYKIVDDVFINANPSVILSAYESTVKAWYETTADARYKTFRRVTTDGGVYKSVVQKYNQSFYPSSRDVYSGFDSQPLIRLPEVYYIAAECEPDADRAAEWLDDVIVTRNGRYGATYRVDFDRTDTRTVLGVVTGQTVRVNELMKEYLKEYYAEGQLFHFYKRFGFRTFPNCPVDDMSGCYQMPVPDDEYVFGNSN